MWGSGERKAGKSEVIWNNMDVNGWETCRICGEYELGLGAVQYTWNINYVFIFSYCDTQHM